MCPTALTSTLQHQPQTPTTTNVNSPKMSTTAAIPEKTSAQSSPKKISEGGSNAANAASATASNMSVPEEIKSKISTLAVVDHETFDQLLEMDEGDPDHPFTREMVDNFFTQAKETFEKMNEEITSNNLSSLSRLGHFLKGSSAALGLLRMRRTCELIQHYGNCMDSEGTVPIEHDVALDSVKEILEITVKEYETAQAYLNDFLAGL